MQYKAGENIPNNYTIERTLGHGAFGTVYLATDNGLQRSVAIKVLHRDDSGLGSSVFSRYSERFELEARLGASFTSDFLTHVYALEKSAESLHLIMEYAPGGSLDMIIETAIRTNEPLSLVQVLQYGMDVARGLELLHKKNIVHRDIKPSNLLLDENERVKIADLGLAQIQGSAFGREQDGSLADFHPGTPQYMPPEQRPPNTMPLRPSADVYALGCVLFELFTGEQYYNHEDIGTRLCDLRPEAPVWLDELIARMLARDYTQRPRDGAQLAEELEGALECLRQNGVDGATSANSFTELQAEQRQKEIASQKRIVRAALVIGWYAQVERAIGNLHKLGPEGTAIAKHVESQLKRSRISPYHHLRLLMWGGGGFLLVLLAIFGLWPWLAGIITIVSRAQATQTPTRQPVSTTPVTVLATLPISSFESTIVLPTVTSTNTNIPVTDTLAPTDSPMASLLTSVYARQGPGYVYPGIYLCALGESFHVTGRDASGEWTQVQLPEGKPGWLQVKFLQLEIDVMSLSVEEAPPTPFPSITVTPSPTKKPRPYP